MAKAKIIRVNKPPYGSWYELVVDGQKVDNVMVLEVTEDLSSIGLQENRRRVEMTIKAEDIIYTFEVKPK